ncbi:MAG TPA: helix-turn-helix domain-containing protein, partial [Solirubrobacterales bacterium]|nr:helix-turn-helix domain-containing protein [Solirubrobacterales bacterium]
ILASAVNVFGKQGFDRTAVEDVIGPAGVSRRTFYDLFSDKDEAFCEAHKCALELLDEQVKRACRSERQWPLEIAVGIATALEWADSNPTLASLLVGGLSMAGPRAAHCHDLLVARFAPRLRLGRNFGGVLLPPSQEEMSIAGISGVVALHVDSQDGDSLVALAPQLVELVLGPYIGVKEARRVATQKRANA